MELITALIAVYLVASVCYAIGLRIDKRKSTLEAQAQQERLRMAKYG